MFRKHPVHWKNQGTKTSQDIGKHMKKVRRKEEKQNKTIRRERALVRE